MQYPTNVPHDSAGTFLLFCRNSWWHFRITAAQFRQWHFESLPWAQELFVVCWHRHENPQTKKTHGVKSQDLGGQFWSPLPEMTRPGKFSRNNSIVSRAVWQVAPSCWNHMPSISIPSNWGHKNKHAHTQLCGNVIENFVKIGKVCQRSHGGHLSDIVFHN